VLKMSHLGAAGGMLLALGGPALAGPTYTFNLDQTQVSGRSGSAGTVTISQDGNDVEIDFVIHGGWGILNTGGPHLPFAFNISSPAGLKIISWTTPSAGNAPHGSFTLASGSGGNTPFGDYTDWLSYSAGNGSGKAYFGNLDFVVGYSSGALDTTAFIANPDGYYFSADITDGPDGPTGASAANTRGTVVPTPEPAGIALFGLGLLSLSFVHRRGAHRA
jgi:hypothetical protein